MIYRCSMTNHLPQTASEFSRVLLPINAPVYSPFIGTHRRLLPAVVYNTYTTTISQRHNKCLTYWMSRFQNRQK
jgi:hypothetical protein